MPANLSHLRKAEAVLAIACLLTAGGMLGSAAFAALSALGNSPWSWDELKFWTMIWLILLPVFALSLNWAKKVAVDILGSSARVSAVAQEPDKKVLIMGMSNLWDDSMRWRQRPVRR